MGAKRKIWVTRLLLLAAIVVAAALVASIPVHWAMKLLIYVIGISVGATIAFRTVAAFDPRGRIQWRLPRSARKAKACALTFDDGPSADTDKVLDILAAAKVKATFFVLAGNARRHPNILRRVAREGHTVAVHGNTHRKLHQATEAVVQEELSTAAAALEALGAKPARLYRTPHGLKNAAVFTVANRLGYKLWAWSRGIWDTDHPASDVLVDRATRFAQPGMVLLLHDGRGDEVNPDIGAMVEALPQIVSRLESAGFRFVTLDSV